jgi:hypothetical protein
MQLAPPAPPPYAARMWRGIISIVLGLGMIIGGLTGKLVLRGTGSGVAIAVVGGVVAGIGVFRILRAARGPG